MPPNNQLADNVEYIEVESVLDDKAYWGGPLRAYPLYDPDPESPEAHQAAREGSQRPITEPETESLGAGQANSDGDAVDPYDSLSRDEMMEALNEAGIAHGLPKNASRKRVLEAYVANFEPPEE